MKNKETLEEAAAKEFPLVDTEWCRTGAAEEENLQLLGHRRSFIKGAKWQQEQDKNNYSEREVLELAKYITHNYRINAWENVKYGDISQRNVPTDEIVKEWFEQFKKSKLC